MQCTTPCAPTSVFPSLPVISALRPHINPRTQYLDPPAQPPLCTACHKAMLFANVRGGDWFIHKPYSAQNRKIVDWVQRVSTSASASASASAAPKRLVVLEVGCGYNTPVVTRFPMEAIARRGAGAGAGAVEVCFVRVNVDHYEVPTDLKHGLCGTPFSSLLPSL